MSKLYVKAFSIALDGYGAGPNQTPDNPLGVGGESLHEWIVATNTFKKIQGEANVGDAAAPDADETFAARSFENMGAWILGRNMFGPIRGAWPDDAWKGWWGENPPYHVPVFVLTHHARASITMQGGTTFHFVTGGIEDALKRAQEAAGSRDIRLGGGVSTIRQYLEAGLIDELHLAIAPVLLGRGEHLLSGIDLLELGYRCTEHVASARATHVVLAKAVEPRTR